MDDVLGLNFCHPKKLCVNMYQYVYKIKGEINKKQYFFIYSIRIDYL